MSAPSDSIRDIYDVEVTREVVLLVEATGSGGNFVIPKGSVVYINRHFTTTTLIQWNRGYFEIPGNTPVVPYVEPQTDLPFGPS